MTKPNPITKPLESTAGSEQAQRSDLRRAWKKFIGTPAVVAATIFLLLLVTVAIFAPQIAPHDPLEQDLIKSLMPPAFQSGGNWSFPLGTDSLGRDLLSRIIYGARVSMSIGGVAVIFSGTLGVLVGLLAGYYGRWVDAVLMRLADIQLAFPFILLAIAVMSVLGASLLNIILVLGITGWVVYARVVRGAVLVVKQQDYVQAAKAMGARDGRVMFKHVLPNITASVTVLATFAFAQFILAEAALSFLGLGVRPPTPTWGGILAEGRDYMAMGWWITTFPGIAIMLTVLAVNIVGDWLRDMLDPNLRRQ
jgi:peptide/nickel transport system permease protein